MASKKPAKKTAKKKPKNKAWHPHQKLENPRHEVFAQQYLIHHNAGAAWRVARGAAPGEKTTPSDHTQGSRVLSYVKTRDRIDHLEKERLERVRLDQDTILTMLSDMAKADITEALDPVTGEVLDLHEVPKPVRMMIEGIEVAEIRERNEEGRMIVIGHTKKIKVASKLRSIELAGKHVAVQAFKETKEIVGKLTLEELLAGTDDESDQP